MKNVYDPQINGDVRSLKGYTHIRAYHGCRPLSLDDYYKDGIRIRTKAELFSEAILRLKGLPICGDDLTRTFNLVWESYHKGSDYGSGVFLDVWKEEFYKGISHYLIYGSEIINATAAALAPIDQLANRYRDELKKTGRPTLIVCEIPISDIIEPYKTCLENVMPICRSAGFCVPYVSPENIIDVIFPSELPDIYWNSNIDLMACANEMR